ncbi:MAG: ankyrin repeat domain-containing protein [Burkholderiaceae bacterium]
MQRGFDPNTRDEKGQPGLTIAVQEHAEKVTRLLLQHPTIDVNAMNSAGESALMMAGLKGDLAATKLLLAGGARVNQPGWSALHYAASGPQPEIVQLLLERGAAVDARSPNGTTPMMMAARYGSEDSVKLMLKRGANPRLANQRELRAADFARLAGRKSLASRLDAAAR